MIAISRPTELRLALAARGRAHRVLVELGEHVLAERLDRLDGGVERRVVGQHAERHLVGADRLVHAHRVDRLFGRPHRDRTPSSIAGSRTRAGPAASASAPCRCRPSAGTSRGTSRPATCGSRTGCCGTPRARGRRLPCDIIAVVTITLLFTYPPTGSASSIVVLVDLDQRLERLGAGEAEAQHADAHARRLLERARRPGGHPDRRVRQRDRLRQHLATSAARRTCPS